MLTDHVKQMIDQSVLCWLATSSLEHRPNVSPKEIFTHFHEGSVIIANIASPGSARNIRENPQGCVSFINIFTQKGYSISGEAQYLRQGDDGYAEIEEPLLAITQGLIPFKSVFRIMGEQVREIVAPRYKLFPETTERDQVLSAMQSYGVRPALDPIS